MKILTAVFVSLFIPLAVCAKVITSLQGREVKSICDVAYKDILAMTGGEPRASAVLILDLTNLDDKNVGARTFFYDEPDMALKTLVPLVDRQCAFHASNRDFTEVVRALPSKQAVSARWISTSGDVAWMLVLFPAGSDKQIRIEEVKRKTHLAADIAELEKLIDALRANAAAVDMVAFPYTLQETRADLTVKVTDKDSKNEKQVFATKSGPVEHLSLSANLPLNSVKQLKLDSDHRVVTKEAPKEFLVAANYSLGDVYGDFERFDPGRIFFTGMVRFSKQPLDTIGAGAGYRLGFASVFGGPVWIRQPVATSASTAAAEPAAEPKMHYKMSWRLGLTFDLGTAVGWVTKDKK